MIDNTFLNLKASQNLVAWNPRDAWNNFWGNKKPENQKIEPPRYTFDELKKWRSTEFVVGSSTEPVLKYKNFNEFLKANKIEKIDAKYREELSRSLFIFQKLISKLPDNEMIRARDGGARGDYSLPLISKGAALMALQYGLSGQHVEVMNTLGRSLVPEYVKTSLFSFLALLNSTKDFAVHPNSVTHQRLNTEYKNSSSFTRRLFSQ
jgi:hypothetical protein